MSLGEGVDVGVVYPLFDLYSIRVDGIGRKNESMHSTRTCGLSGQQKCEYLFALSSNNTQVATQPCSAVSRQ